MVYLKKPLSWQDPLELAYAVSNNQNYQENWVFLYSGLSNISAPCFSYLALYPVEEIIAENFKGLEAVLSANQSYFENGWFGYLGYGLKNELEILPKDLPSLINLPPLWMIKFNLILEFNHYKKRLICHASDCKFLNLIPVAASLKRPSKITVNLSKLGSNFNKEQYLKKVQAIKEKIAEGDVYQANLTRKFWAVAENIDPFSVFRHLNNISPSNYSAFIKLKKNYIISSSPELFLKIDKKGKVCSMPIKGTAPRFADPSLDRLSKKALQYSGKERSENLMIVDLVRNDLSRGAEIGSVKVRDLFKITSYKTIHHMSSLVEAIKRPKVSTLELVKNCFPPGSMTGAPKIKAMEICSQLEERARGIYSGALGFFGGDGSCNLSVVIRTIIVCKEKNESFLEFQVGGGITFESEPLKEWQETLNKAKGIAKALNIKLAELKKL